MTLATCPACASELDHCHGTLVLHISGDVECTDRDCAELVRSRHGVVVVCTEVAPPCGCVE